MEEEELTQRVIGCAMKVHSALGPGFFESVYQRSLVHELCKASIRAECETPIQVHYDGIIAGHFSVDILVENRLILELKATQALAPAHEVQLVNYLAATGLDIGLLLNFGSDRLEFKRKNRTYRPKRIQTDPLL